MVTKKLKPKKGPKKAARSPKKAAKAPRKAAKAPRKGAAKAKRKKRVRKIKISPWYIAVLLFVVAICVMTPYILSGRFASNGARVTSGGQEYCMDISHHNEGIDWNNLKVAVDRNGRTTKDLIHAKKVSPVSVVIIKATEGEKMVDKRFKEYWRAAGVHGYRRGAYHFFRSSKDPTKQARKFISTVHLGHNDFPPVLDVETMHAGCSKKELNRKVLVWLREVENHYGRKPIVYTSDSYARNVLSKEITNNYPMWIARYNKKEPEFRKWIMWQFTEEAVVYGVKGYVDLSVIKRYP